MQLNYHGYFNNTGYSIAAQDYILAMQSVKPDVDIRVHYINGSIAAGVSSNRKQLFAAMHNKESKDSNINLYHSIPVRYRRAAGKQKHLGFCVFETINPPPDWIETMNNMDGIITASNFNKSVFEASGVKVPIHVVPHCFDPKLFHRNVKPKGRFRQTTFISMGTWKDRKNWKLLIQAWYEAFEERNSVCLYIKTDKPNELKRTVQEIKKTGNWRSKSTAPIYCEENPLCDFEEIPRILRKGDIYISASMGEGFGICGLHAMALGLPVVTTRFGGCLQYAEPSLCTYIEPVRYKRVAVMDKIPQLSNCIWPHLDVKEVAQKMQYILHSTKERDQKAEAAYEAVHRGFTYEVIGKKMLEVLELS